jgi:hypothetical protein
MERWKSLMQSLKPKPQEDQPGPVSLGARRAAATFFLIMGVALLLLVLFREILR